ncbi:hypothetical protein NKT35_11215 [Chromobacterium sp. IIBBL 290-4]|nr:hypothetical protein [Chromobacterium sp. IIBBL 290-4]UTH76627.1 hypothetical protein NKT35_11215 [Chromobacterium sp. IIBBL 290-4]
MRRMVVQAEPLAGGQAADGAAAFELLGLQIMRLLAQLGVAAQLFAAAGVVQALLVSAGGGPG